MPWEVPYTITVKLILHHVTVLALLSWLGPFDANRVYTAVLMAALPPALNVFIMARQYDTWVAQALRLGAVRDLRVGGDADHHHVAGENGQAARNAVVIDAA